MKDIKKVVNVKIQSTLGSIETNLAEVKIQLDEEFKGMLEKKVTLSQLPEAKKSVADARKIYQALEKKRISIKKEWNKPYDSFNEKYKEAMSSLTLYIDNIKSQISEIEEAQKEEKLKEIESLLNELLSDYSDSIKSFVKKADWFDNPKWENKTFTIKKIEEEIKEKLSQISNDLTVLAGFEEIYNALLVEYTRHGNLSQTLILKDTLIAEKEYQEKLKEELEKAKKVEDLEEEIKKPEEVLENADFYKLNDLLDEYDIFKEGESVPLDESWASKERVEPKLSFFNESDYQNIEVDYRITGSKAMVRYIKDMARFYGAKIEMVGTPKVVK